jgi:hypothetical protein
MAIPTGYRANIVKSNEKMSSLYVKESGSETLLGINLRKFFVTLVEVRINS